MDGIDGDASRRPTRPSNGSGCLGTERRRTDDDQVVGAVCTSSLDALAGVSVPDGGARRDSRGDERLGSRGDEALGLGVRDRVGRVARDDHQAPSPRRRCGAAAAREQACPPCLARRRPRREARSSADAPARATSAWCSLARITRETMCGASSGVGARMTRSTVSRSRLTRHGLVERPDELARLDAGDARRALPARTVKRASASSARRAACAMADASPTSFPATARRRRPGCGRA